MLVSHGRRNTTVLLIVVGSHAGGRVGRTAAVAGDGRVWGKDAGAKTILYRAMTIGSWSKNAGKVSAPHYCDDNAVMPIGSVTTFLSTLHHASRQLP